MYLDDSLTQEELGECNSHMRRIDQEQEQLMQAMANELGDYQEAGELLQLMQRTLTGSCRVRIDRRYPN
jgi:hypothetical protein